MNRLTAALVVGVEEVLVVLVGSEALVDDEDDGGDEDEGDEELAVVDAEGLCKSHAHVRSDPLGSTRTNPRSSIFNVPTEHPLPTNRPPSGHHVRNR